MLILEILQPFVFKTRSRGYLKGQHDLTLIALDQNDEEAGHIDYSTWQGHVSVQFIKAVQRGYGVGPALVRQLQREFPDTEIDFGLLTGDGAKMLAKLPTTYTPDPDYAAKSERLHAIKQQLADWSSMANDPAATAETHAFLRSLGERWNDLYDEEWRLEQELSDSPPGKRLIDLA